MREEPLQNYHIYECGTVRALLCCWRTAEISRMHWRSEITMKSTRKSTVLTVGWMDVAT